MELAAHIEEQWGQPVSNLAPLGGGCIGEVYRAETPDGAKVVVKSDRSGAARLDIEGYMLQYLSQHSLPTPPVLYAAPSLLIMEYVDGNSRFSAEAESHAADLLADLHAVQAPQYGMEQDTLIGSLHQPNPWSESWVEFFRDQRLLFMAEEARRQQALPADTFHRLQKLADRLTDFLDEPPYPSLLHGDVWTTNVLAKGGRITAFLDPAIYYGHPEIELAFITLFTTFGDAFFRRYGEKRPIAPAFFETRRDIYNLYPLLVHTRLFGGGYATSVSGIVQKLGF